MVANKPEVVIAWVLLQIESQFQRQTICFRDRRVQSNNVQQRPTSPDNGNKMELLPVSNGDAIRVMDVRRSNRHSLKTHIWRWNCAPMRDAFGVLTTSGFDCNRLVSVVGRCRSLLYVIDLNSMTSKTYGLIDIRSVIGTEL